VEPNVDVSFKDRPAEVREADLAVLPGSRATLVDLAWLRDRGLADAVVERHRAGRPVLGICGGFQMLGRRVADPDAVESAAPASAPGLGLLPASTRFLAGKVLGRPRGSAWGEQVTGYEIHHGAVDVRGGDPFPGGCAAGATWGTLWHGLLESDGFRRRLLTEVAAAAGRSDWMPCPGISFAGHREARLEALAVAVEAHLDTAAVARLLDL
jgi:adenosylcobyric acid synthase